MTHPKVSNTENETNPIYYDFSYLNPNAYKKKKKKVMQLSLPSLWNQIALP